MKDLLGWDHDVARQHLRVAQHVGPRFALDGTPLEPVLPATAAAFATNTTRNLLASWAAAADDPEPVTSAETPD